MQSPADAQSPPTHVVVTWRHRAWALLSGMLYAFSQPFVFPGHDPDIPASLQRPSHLLGWFCLVPLLWTIRRMGARQAYTFSTWAFVPGVFVMLYWLVVAMHVFGHIPLAVALGLLLLLSFVGWNFMATSVAAARWMETRWGWPAALATPVAWTGMEMCRAYVYFGGFPWGNLGSSQWNNTVVLQLASLGGVYAILFVLALVNVAITEGLRWRAGERARPDRVWLATALVLAGTWAWGAFEVKRVEEAMVTAPRLKVGMLQGNIEQGIKNQDNQHFDYIVNKYAALQRSALEQGAQVIVWPEGALPGHIERTTDTMNGRGIPPLGNAVGVVGVSVYWRDPPLLTGDACRGPKLPADCRGRPWQHNSAVVVDPQQRILGRFDKTHLVPFGEYVPWPLAAVARALVPGIAAYVPGEKLDPVVLPLDGKPRIGGLICYEGVFPQYARAFTKAGAQLLINATNDAWYGISSAAPQHLAFYSIRAAENARAVARVANTGITAGVDPLGRILVPSTVFTDAAVVEDLPLMDLGTPYTFTGDVFGWANAVAFLLALGGALRAGWLARRQRRAAARA